jgi:hypothetical protein
MKRLGGMLAIAAAITLLLSAEPAQAGWRFGIGVRIPSPLPPRVLVAHPYRVGEVWVRGHWLWSPLVRHYVWVPGRWIGRHHRSGRVDGFSTHTRHGRVFFDGYRKRDRM